MVGEYRGSFCTGRDIRSSCRGDPMFNVGTGDGIGVEGFDIEDNGYDVQIQPKTSTQVWSLRV